MHLVCIIKEQDAAHVRTQSGEIKGYQRKAELCMLGSVWGQSVLNILNKQYASDLFLMQP